MALLYTKKLKKCQVLISTQKGFFYGNRKFLHFLEIEDIQQGSDKPIVLKDGEGQCVKHLDVLELESEEEKSHFLGMAFKQVIGDRAYCFCVEEDAKNRLYGFEVNFRDSALRKFCELENSIEATTGKDLSGFGSVRKLGEVENAVYFVNTVGTLRIVYNV